MKPKIDITITDTNGAYSSLADNFEPYEVYVNNERFCTSERLDGLESENAKLREFAQAMADVAYEGQMLCDKCRFSHGCYNGGKKEHEGRGCQWLLWARELGIEVDDD